MNKKFLEFYNYAIFSLGVFITLMGIFNAAWLLVVLGLIIIAPALGTVLHLATGRHNKFSKLPKDFNTQNPSED